MIKWITKFRFNKYQNLALQKLGRNLHNFSLVEYCLKYIVTVSNVTVLSSTSGPVFHSKSKRNIEKTQRMMLGQLVHEVFQLWNPDSSIYPETQDLFDIHLKTSMKIEMSTDDYQKLKASLEVMLDDRNSLIHGFNQKFSLDNVNNCRVAITYLDDMREKHLPSIQYLQEVVKTFIELSAERFGEVEGSFN